MSTPGLRRIAGPPGRAALRSFAGLRMRRWPNASRLFVVGERTGWSVDEDASHVAAAARRLGYEVAPAQWAGFAERQSVFLTSHFEAIQPRWAGSANRLGTAWMHGRPGTPGAPEFDRAFEALRRDPGRFARVQVTHAEMRELVVSAGVDPACVHVIPLGIDLEHFPLGDSDRRRLARDALGLPGSAFVAGSFQKDGVGWGEGLEPKLVKGPDVLLAALERLRDRVPDLVVLLTGPARGYVRGGLDERRIPYVHVVAGSRAELARAYHALDVYLVASRQEGGPKAVLESMATGVPLVTTRVGQAPDLVEHGVSGFLVEVEDAAGLAEWAVRVSEGAGEALRGHARKTAERYALERLDGSWAALLDGYVDRSG